MASRDVRNDNRFQDATKLQIYWLYWHSEILFTYTELAKLFDYSYAAIRKVVIDREMYEAILGRDADEFYINNKRKNKK